jgi:hypothetical protein
MKCMLLSVLLARPERDAHSTPTIHWHTYQERRMRCHRRDLAHQDAVAVSEFPELEPRS